MTSTEKVLISTDEEGTCGPATYHDTDQAATMALIRLLTRVRPLTGPEHLPSNRLAQANLEGVK